MAACVAQAAIHFMEERMISITNRLPSTLDDLVFNDANTEKRVRQYAEGKRGGNILIYGPTGTGKSTTARVIVEHIFNKHNCPNPVPVIHAKSFTPNIFRRFDNEWQTQKTWGIKAPYCIVDEVDQLSPELQRQLRAKIDETTIGNFIFTTNKIYGLDDPLIDRCDDIEMPAINPQMWIEKVNEWLREENVVVPEQVVQGMVATNNGTIRDLKRIAQDIACDFE